MIEQGSTEWFQQRLGKITASRIADVMARTKTGYGASRKNYLAQLVAERMTGQPYDSYTSPAMQWGIEHESEARDLYEFMTGHEVKLAEFVDHPSIKMCGASPDGHASDGLIEIKCPNTATHIDTLLSQKIDDKYILQMLWQMECANKSWCDFVSFDPRMPEELQIFIQRVDFDEDRAKEIRIEVEKLLVEIDETILKLEQIKEAA